MGDSGSWVATEPSTRVQRERETEAKSKAEDESNDKSLQVKRIPSPTESARQLEAEGTFAILLPQNRFAREAFRRLARTQNDVFQHHKQFIQLDEREDIDDADREDCFILSLGLLPEFPALGWRVGRGRANRPNHGVDILIHEGEDLAGVHCRFCWVRGGGGFFIVADNLRGVPVILNGETLRQTQRLLPYRNSIILGECNFSVQFKMRSRDEEDQFQVELSAFYSRVLRESVPMLLPTPSGNEVTIGNWIVRNPIASGSFGRVSVVTHMYTGQPAAAKELWRTPRNSYSVDREVSIARKLKNFTHKRLGIPFEIYHRKVYDKAERIRIASLLDQTWKPGQTDAIDLYILYSPLSTSNFLALYKSKASLDIRTRLFTQVLDGIAFLHENGITHRDVKPANLTVRSYDPPDAQIIDFGCATTEQKTLYDRPGTIPYLAPEQRDGLYHDRTVDYWASGLVGAELLGFRRNNDRITGDNLEAIHKFLDEQTPHAIVKACRQMLKVEPKERLAAADALDIYLHAFKVDIGKGSKRALDEK
ncbi:kinase-like domain-containing protein [Halenospora varia]|nr:kinase-like domain-containing protein [Halenospora varia]